MALKCQKGQEALFGTRNPRGRMERMNVKRWMRGWQDRFSPLGVQIIVADVAQSSILVDAAEQTIVLAPSLKLSAADKLLDKIYGWWQRQGASVKDEPSFLVSR